MTKRYTNDFPDIFVSGKLLKLAAIAVIVLFATMAASVSASPDRRAMFDRFKAQYHKSYATPEEEQKRFVIFAENMAIAEMHSLRNPQATFGINEFSDVSKDEFKVYHSAEHLFARDAARRNDPRNPNLLSKDQIPQLAAGSQIDWRQKGAVTGVKNQGLKCGSCYSFSSTGNIEGQWFLAGNPLTSLSEQEIVSCQPAPAPKAGGCHGGLPDITFGWLVSGNNGQIVTEASYPYVSGDGNVPACDMSNRVVGATIAGHRDIPQDENSMASYTFTNGPISIGVDGTSFQSYTGGIITDCIGSQVDHAVLIVGFDETASTPYWIIKNSWGASWGEAGYVRVAKGSNQCLITTAPSSSFVSKNPNPVPPSPPTPVTPAPAPLPPTPPTPPTPSGGNYTYLYCTGNDCTNCQSYNFPQGACIDNESAGSSFKATCSSSGSKVHLTMYSDSQKCFGHRDEQTIDAATCYQNEATGTFLKILC